MIKLIEGARNSGKSYLLQWANVKPYKFDFPFWYGKLKLNNKDRETHSFALSKEILLHELNRDGLLAGDVYVDRGILTVLTWGVLKDRISMDEAIKQLWHFSEAGLFKNCEVFIFMVTILENEDRKIFGTIQIVSVNERSMRYF